MGILAMVSFRAAGKSVAWRLLLILLALGMLWCCPLNIVCGGHPAVDTQVVMSVLAMIPGTLAFYKRGGVGAPVDPAESQGSIVDPAQSCQSLPSNAEDAKPRSKKQHTFGDEFFPLRRRRLISMSPSKKHGKKNRLHRMHWGAH